MTSASPGGQTSRCSERTSGSVRRYGIRRQRWRASQRGVSTAKQRSRHPQALCERPGDVLHRLQAPRRSVVSLVQRRSRTSTWRPTTELGQTTRNSRSSSRRRGGRPGMRSTGRDTSDPAVSTPVTRTAMALTEPPNSTQLRTRRASTQPRNRTPRARLAAEREKRWAVEW